MGTLNIKQQLALLIKDGISFEVNQGKLLVKGNLNVLDNERKEFLKQNKAAIISLIESQLQEMPPIKKMDINIPGPLSFSQQGLWLLDKINNGSAHYNLTSTFKLKGRVDYEALNDAFTAILERHTSLRSVFFVGDSGEPVQKVQPANEFRVVIDDITSPVENIDAVIRAKIEKESNRLFDLAKDILLSVQLLKMNSEEHILVVTMHHIASDGWSMGILVKEFNMLYSSRLNGEGGSLPALDIQYSDYAHWQRQWLKGSVLDGQIDYWKKQLAGLPVIHNLPLDHPRPSLLTFNGNTYNSFIGKDTLDALYNLCKAESATLFMGIHAAFSCLLARYSNEKDIVVGTPVANRGQAEVAGLVGFFMNLMVLRADLSKEPAYRELLRQSKKMLEHSYEYQQVPFEKLVDELKVKRNLDHAPLFQILLALHNNSREEVSLAGLVLEPVNYNSQEIARYDLSLNISETPGGLVLSWEYNTALFERTTIVRMAEHFNTLTTALLANPDENVFKVNMIGHEESGQLYKHLQGEQLHTDNCEHVLASFSRYAANNPDDVAVISNDVSYTYQQLSDKVDQVAHYLLNQGVQNGDKVGICLLRNVEMVAALFACLKIGAAYIPLDPVYSSERLNQVIGTVQPKCIVTLNALKTLYLKGAAGTPFICLDKLSWQKAPVIAAHYDNDTIAYIIFTSGTTGRPKGIEVTHSNLNNLLKGFDLSFGGAGKQQWLAQTSVNFDISVLELIWTISRGQTIVLQQSNPFKLLSHDKITPAKPIGFSVMFFGADKSKGHKYDLVFDTAKYADENNFTAIWTPERHFGEFGGAFSSPSVLSSAIAAATKNISIRAGSVVLPLHDPIRVAEEWSVVDNISNGRIAVSIASGWQPDDFVIANANYAERHKIMREKITELKALWNGNTVVRKNGLGKDFSITIRPTPIQRELPLWITAAGSPDTFKYAGEIGANVLTHMLGQSLDRLKENIAVYHQALKENGFAIEDKEVTLMLHTYIDSSIEAAMNISEQPFRDYLASSVKLMEPLAKELGLDIETQGEEIIDIAYKKFSKENTLIGTAESCQAMLFSLQDIGVTEVACLVDFGVGNEKVMACLEQIVETRSLYDAQAGLAQLLHINNQGTELELIHKHKITHVQTTPSQAKLIVDLSDPGKPGALSTVQHWFIGGEPVSRNLIEGLTAITHAKLYNMYGPTETTVWSTWREISSNDCNIGGPVLNTSLLLLNEFEQQVPAGVVGELYIGGAGVAKGYYNDIELTNKSFITVTNPHFGTGRFYRTGDLMKMTSNGNFEYVGRKDNQVKLNGYRIELEEIERTIAKVPGVKNCKVLPIKEDNAAYLSAYVVREDIVYGDYEELPPEEQARPFHFPDGSTVYHQSDRQLAMLYKEIFVDEIYFRHNITVPANGLVLDVGANIGSFSMHLSQKHPGATVIAFEPVPQIFSALKKNFEHRQIKGRILNYGISDKKETAIFHYYPEMSGMSGRFVEKEAIVDAVGKYIEHDKVLRTDSTKYTPGETNSIVQSYYNNIDGQSELSNEFDQYLTSLYESKEVGCRLTTISDIIDELNIRSIDLLKVDVEKSECLVLNGIRPEHWPMIHQVAIEVDGDNNLDTILNLLNEKGYDVKVDELVMSDAELPSNDNTYMLYARNDNNRNAVNEIAHRNFETQAYETNIREFLKKMLPEYMVPRNITFVPSIPLMENGKIDMVKLKQIRTQEQPPVASITKLNGQVELDVYRIWCEVLKREAVPYHVSIFEAGGNSIEVVLLHDRLQKEFNVQFSLIELFRNPTIAQQAKLVQNAGNTSGGETIKKAINKGASRRNARAGRTN